MNKETTFGARALRGCLAVSPLAAAACGGQALTTTEEVSAVASADTTTDFQDGTGTVLVRVKTCSPTPMKTTNCAYCVVDPGWARVGGGAKITGSAELQANYPFQYSISGPNDFGCTGGVGRPNEDQQAWFARSSGGNHVLQTYVIGLQVRNGRTGTPFTPAYQTADDVVIDSQTANTLTIDNLESNAVGATLMRGFMVGGGAAIINVNSPGQDVSVASDAFLTESRPMDGAGGREWRATLLSQSSPPQTQLKSYAIVMENCPAAWQPYCFTYPSIRSATGNASSGYGSTSFALSASWVQTSVGGWAPSGGASGRALSDMIPFMGTSGKGLFVGSRPIGSSNSAQTLGYDLAIGTTGALYDLNTIVLQQGGTMARGPGNNPHLQQSTAAADLPATRWYVEDQGNGVYRLHNGNPDSGTDCAYRESNSTNVRVAACGSRNEFQWTVFSGDVIGVFSLRNVAANQCLDNNGNGFVTSDLLLKNCDANSVAQQMFLDAFNWPPR